MVPSVERKHASSPSCMNERTKSYTGSFAEAGGEVVDDEQFHRFPFRSFAMMAWYNMNRETQGKEHRVYIANQENLAAFAERAMHSSVLAIDTEFLREKTYYAKLCLIQLATDDETAIVDPFAVDDLKVLAPVLRNENVMKLFHAGNQDLEILLREVGVLPHPLFDTQVAAALLGHTQQIGYAALVHAECGVTLKKIDSFTDWSRRRCPTRSSSTPPTTWCTCRACTSACGRSSWSWGDCHGSIATSRIWRIRRATLPTSASATSGSNACPSCRAVSCRRPLRGSGLARA